MKPALALCLVVGNLVACGPGERDGDGNGSGSGSGSGDCPSCVTLTGRVWAPKWAPGDVPAGQEIPIFGATLYVSQTKPAPIPDHTYCESCIDTPQGSVQSSYDGSFTLTVDQPGHYWLVIQKGPFRLEQEIDLAPGELALPPQSTTLPSRMDPQNGAWIPKVAIARGNFDAVEDILGKIGFGAMSGNKLGSPAGEGGYPEITFYTYGGTGPGSVAYLVSTPEELRKYHIIFFPCSTQVDDALMQDQTILKNIRRFVADGGKLYVTDWAGETADRAFPPQVQLGDGFFGGIDSKGTYDPITLDGTLTEVGDADGDYYDAPDGKAVDPDLNMWLGLQTGPTEDSPVPQMYNPDYFTVSHNFNYIVALQSVMKGTDDDGMPVYDDPKTWVTGSDGVHGAGPLAVTYEPAGCGKVLFSTFQTAGASASDSHVGLMPQERVLLFLIMEISACTKNPVIL
jgi:hypothetical protein